MEVLESGDNLGTLLNVDRGPSAAEPKIQIKRFVILGPESTAPLKVLTTCPPSRMLPWSVHYFL